MKTFLSIYIIIAFMIVTLGWVYVWKNKYDSEDANLFFFVVGVTWPICFAVVCLFVFGLGFIAIIRDMIQTIREK